MKSTTKLSIGIAGILVLLLITIQVMSSPNQPDNRTVGYEELDNGQVWHIWNEVDDYYFNTSSGIQLTNHYNDYWTRNIFCGEWKDIEYCLDSLPFTWNITTDNETFAEIYGTYYILESYFYINYTLYSNHNNLTINIGFVNNNFEIENDDINFIWKITDINIPYNDTDLIAINSSSYTLDIDSVFENTSIFWLYDNSSGNFLMMDYSDNALVDVNNDVKIILPYSNNYEFHWIDASCTITSCDLVDPTSNITIDQGESFTYRLNAVTGCPPTRTRRFTAQYKNYTDRYYTITNSTGLTTLNANPVETSNNSAEWTVNGTNAGNYSIRGKCEIIGIITKYSEIKHVNVTIPIANETEGGQAIEEGINNTIPNATVYTDQQIYTVNESGYHSIGLFDKVAILGNQTWALNYITGNESFTYVQGIGAGNTVNIWENQSLNYSEIVWQVESFINETRE